MHSFYSVDEFVTCKDNLRTILFCETLLVLCTVKVVCICDLCNILLSV
jgi:hypothetical protein